MGTLQDMVVKPWNVSMDDGDAPSLFDIMYEVARRLDALAMPTDAARGSIAEFCSEFDLMREHLTDEQLANVLARYGYVPKWALSDCEAERDGAIKRAEYAEAERDSLKAQNKKLSEAFDRMCAHVADLEDEVEGRTEGVEEEAAKPEPITFHMMWKDFLTYAPMHKDKWKESLWRGRPLTELSRDELMDAWVELAQMCLPH